MKTYSPTILTFLLFAFANTLYAQWSDVPTDLPRNNQASYMTDQFAFLVGSSNPTGMQVNGHISKSTDGGMTFSNILSKNVAEYTAVYFVNEHLGFVGGDHSFNAVILRTTDGGNTWQTTMLNEFVPMFEEFYFINEEVGFVVGGYGKDLIFKTENGGDTWENITFSDGPNLSNISFVDDSVGFVSSVFGDIYKTINQGESWNVLQHLPPMNQIHDMHFINESIGLVANNHREIYRTENGGADWMDINLHGVDSIGPVRFHFVNDITGFIMTYAENQRKLFQTTDAGETWSEIFNADNPYSWTFMAFSPSNTNALLGGSNSLYINTDAEELVVTSSLTSTIKELSKFTLSPNPAKDEIDVELSFDTNIPFQINLLDALGKNHGSWQFESREVSTKLLLNTLSTGMYYVQIVTENGVAVKNLIRL